MKTCCIVIPVYREPTIYERYSYETLLNIVKDKYDIYIVCPDEYSCKYFNNDSYMYFEKKYFDGLAGYSSLCKTYEFYNTFKDYRYMLIYQLDCLLFRDDIEYWCNEDYDYIGAPIISPNANWLNVPAIGNGGLSLRKISTFLELTNPNGDFLKKYQLTTDNNKYELYNKFEDLYFCEYVSNKWLFDTPTYNIAKKFAFDMNPDVIYSGEIPMGCHAYCKNFPFWQKVLKNIPEDVLQDCFKEHSQFVNLYYKQFTTLC